MDMNKLDAESIKVAKLLRPLVKKISRESEKLDDAFFALAGTSRGKFVESDIKKLNKIINRLSKIYDDLPFEMI